MQLPEGADRSPAADGLPVMPRRRPGRRVVVMVAVLTVVALAAAVLLGLRWWSHPDLLAGSANNGSLSMRPQPLSHSQLTFTVIHPAEDDDPETVTFSSTPEMTFETNSARATGTFNICYQRDGKGTNLVIGSARGTGGRYCARLEPVEAGTSLQLPSPDAYIVATLTPHRPGRVVVTGVEFSYALGADRWWSRRGVEHVSTRVVLQRIRAQQSRQG